jgi:hypothetical protein
MKMNKIPGFVKILGALALVSTLSGCFGEVAEVPTAHRGVLSTSAGVKEGIIPPSKMRLATFCRVCDNLILAEISDYNVKETMTLYMPKDRLNLTIDVRGTFATADDPEMLNMIFSRVSPTPVTDRVSKIDKMTVYNIYAQQIIRDRVRSVIAQYDIATVMESREAIGAEIREAVREALEGRPVSVLNFGLADLQPPKVILEAEIGRKTREIEINRAEADKEIRLRQAEANLEVAALEQGVALKEAETQVLVQQKLTAGFSEAYVAQRALNVLEAMAASDNKVIFLPTEALSNPAIMIGAMQDALPGAGGTASATPPVPQE